MQIRLRAAKMARKGVQRCPHELQLMPNRCQNHRKRCGLGSLLGKYIAPILGTSNSKIGGRCVLLFDELRCEIRRQSNKQTPTQTQGHGNLKIGGLSVSFFDEYGASHTQVSRVLLHLLHGTSCTLCLQPCVCFTGLLHWLLHAAHAT